MHQACLNVFRKISQNFSGLENQKNAMGQSLAVVSILVNNSPSLQILQRRPKGKRSLIPYAATCISDHFPD